MSFKKMSGLRTLLILALIVLLALFVIVLAVHEHEQQLMEAALSEADLSNGAYSKVERLYEDKARELEGHVEELFALWDYVGPVEIVEDDTESWLCVEPPYIFISKDPQCGEYVLEACDTSFQCQECEWDCTGELKAFLDILWSEYEVKYIYLTSEFVSFQIIEDRLTYYRDEGMIGSHENKLDDHWGHFWFEYGI